MKIFEILFVFRYQFGVNVNQEAFIKNEVQVIVATSAFGMGVDKKDVKLVIHYDILIVLTYWAKFNKK